MKHTAVDEYQEGKNTTMCGSLASQKAHYIKVN